MSDSAEDQTTVAHPLLTQPTKHKPYQKPIHKNPEAPLAKVVGESYLRLTGRYQQQMAVNAVRAVHLSGLVKSSAPSYFEEANPRRLEEWVMTSVADPDVRVKDGKPPKNPRPPLPPRANHVLDLTLGPIVG